MLRALLGAILAVSLLAGCTPEPTPDPLEPDSAQVAESLTSAIRLKSEQQFAANFATSTVGVALAEQWYSNLSQFEDVSFTAVSGSGQLQVTWSVPGQSTPSRETLSMQMAKVGGRTLILDRLASSSPPSWLFGRVTVTNVDEGTLIAAETVSESESKAWLKRLKDAVKVVKDAKLGSTVESWDGRLVVELPRTTSEYTELVDVDPTTSSAAAECESGAVHIVVNPASLSAPDPEGQALMAHEAVHAATASPCSKSGAWWATEGLAEWVAQEAYSSAAAQNEALVKNYVAHHGVPAALPADPAAEDRDAIAAAYALSGVVVDVCVDEMGRKDALELVGKLAKGTAPDAEKLAEILGWYQAALQKIAKS